MLQVAYPGVPPWRVDGRKWRQVRLDVLTWQEVVDQPEGKTHVLYTPLVLQAFADRARVIQEAHRVLAPGGEWYLVDLVPTSMPAHWAFTFFPDLWRLVQERAWDTRTLYVALREAGFQVKMKEQAFYQAVSLGAARALAAERTGWLAHLSEEAYHEGLARLDAAIAEQGEDALIGSEVVFVVAHAWKR